MRTGRTSIGFQVFAGASRIPAMNEAYQSWKAEELRLKTGVSPGKIIHGLERILRLRHYSHKTVRSYVGWVRRYLQYVEQTGCGVDICRIQQLMGHKSVETTMVYTHVLASVAPPVRSPLDEL